MDINGSDVTIQLVHDDGVKKSIAQFRERDGETCLDGAKKIAFGDYDLYNIQGKDHLFKYVLARFNERGLLDGGDDPCLECDSRYFEWRKNGILDRSGAPAIIALNFVNGQWVSVEEWYSSGIRMIPVEERKE